jgi:acyl-CoA synthetase (AMP-forming)/AMP-acid ligase II
MLYERWRQIAREFSGEFALHDLASGRRWTFGELADEAAKAKGKGQKEKIIYPRGGGAEFILQVLGAWRENKILCPLESGQTAPSVGELPTNIVHLKTTSASGGKARAVAFTAAQLAADAENIVATMGLRRAWTNLGVISLAHSYGFSNLVTPLLLHGVPLILAPAPLPETVRTAAKLAEHISLPAVPALWRAWFEAGAIPANVQLAISAGAPLPLALEQAVFEKLALKLHNFYGASECGGIAYDASEIPRADTAGVGTAIKNVSLAVGDDGCLQVRSRAVAAGVVGDGSWGGVFGTSDLAELVGGEVFLRGRAGDLINVAGRKILPEAIEQALLKMSAVRACLVFGTPSADAARGEEVVAVVVSEADEGELRRGASELLPAWQLPRHWWRVAELPVNARGKISRAAWRERWWHLSR